MWLVADVVPEGRPTGESNPAASARSRGGTPVLGHDKMLPRVPREGTLLACSSAFRQIAFDTTTDAHTVPHTIVRIVA